MQLTDAMKRLTDLYQDAVEATHLEALSLVARDHVRKANEDSATVRYAGGKTATIIEGQCNCDRLRDDDSGPCAHLLAVDLFQLLQDATPQYGAGGVPIPIVERHIEKIVSGMLLTEAPYAVTLTVEDADGYQFTLTVRKQDPQQFFEALQGLRAWVKKQGFLPAMPQERGQPSPAGTGPAGEEQRAMASAADLVEKDRVRETGARAVRQFHAETLHRSDLDDKIFWAIKGLDMPRWNVKHGMRVWPEVLREAGFDVDLLIDMSSKDFPPLKGYVAEYMMREDDPQKPDKIIRLMKER